MSEEKQAPATKRKRGRPKIKKADAQLSAVEYLKMLDSRNIDKPGTIGHGYEPDDERIFRLASDLVVAFAGSAPDRFMQDISNNAFNHAVKIFELTKQWKEEQERPEEQKVILENPVEDVLADDEPRVVLLDE